MHSILVVEDSTLSRKMVVKALEAHQFNVIQAKNGQEALDLYRERKSEIACVISDNLMPVMSGLELLAAIRSEDTSMPVIMASADIQKTTRTECERLGITAFLNKPVQGEELLAAVNEALELTTA